MLYRIRSFITYIHVPTFTAALAQSIRAFALHAEGMVFVSQPRQTYVVKTGSDSFTAKRLATGGSVRGPRR